MCEPDIAYATTSYIGYSTPNSAAFDMLDEETQNDNVSYPDSKYLDNNTTIFRNLSDEANQEMQDLWTDIKSTQDESHNKWIVPLFLVACITLSIVIIIRRHIIRKKDVF